MNTKYKVINLILVIYLILSFFITNLIDKKIYYLVINPIFWLIILIYLYYLTNNYHGKFSNLIENEKTLFIYTLIYIIIYYLSGLIFTYVKSPYSKSLLSIITNFIQIVFIIICLEYTRSVLVNKNKKNTYMIVFITILLMLFDLNISNLINSFNTKQDIFIYISSQILPIIFSNILYSYLTLVGSYKLVLTYRLPIEIAALLVPVFPNLDWFITGILGMIVPAIIYLNLKYYINIRDIRRKHRKRSNPISYIPFITIITIFVLFVSGIFKYKPIAILSNSMNPVFYKGDIVIYRKLDNNELKKLKNNYIIIYNKENQIIVHRIVDKYYSKGKLFYITKGDANPVNDSNPVPYEDIIGLYETSIKYIGKPSVWLHDFFKNEQ